MEEALTGTPQEEQKRRRRTSPLFWLVWAVLIFCTLFWCGQVATRGSSGARPEGSTSGLSADYRPWPELLFGPVGPGFIEDLQKALGAIAPPSGSGSCLLGVACAPIPTDTPTATRTPVPTRTPTVTPTPTRTPTRTPVPSWTPTRMKDPPAATPLPSCDNVDASLSAGSNSIVMSLTNNNSGAMHLTSSTVVWPSGNTLMDLSFTNGSYGTGLPSSSGLNVSPAGSPPLPSGGTPTWTATFVDVGPGTYTVTLNFGCNISRSTIVIATPVPPPNQAPDGTIDDPTGGVTITEGQSVNFAGSGTDPDGNTPLTYLWDFDGGATNSTVEDPGSVAFNTAGFYTVTFTVTDSLGLADATPATVTITVNAPPPTPPPPTADFSWSWLSGFEVSFTDTSTDFPTSWDWDFGDGSGTSTSQNPTYTFSASGTYSVTLTASNASGSDTSSQTVTVP